MEVWKDVYEYEGLYLISSLGSVKSIERCVNHWRGGLRVIKERILKHSCDKDGYHHVGLSKCGKTKTVKVHKLMAIAFLNHVPNGCTIVVDHKDNDKSNNDLDNLQLITHRKNSTKDMKGHSSDYVGVTYIRKENHYKSSIQHNGNSIYLGYFKSEIDAASAYNKKLNQIRRDEF